MLVRSIAALALGATVTLAAAAEATSRPSAGAPCILRGHHVVSVDPYRVEEHAGKATFKALRGADVRIEAEPGLTAEWLRLQLGRHVAEMRGMGMKDCAFDVNSVNVQVESSGAGFVVRIVAEDPDRAEEVLRRAKLLLD